MRLIKFLFVFLPLTSLGQVDSAKIEFGPDEHDEVVKRPRPQYKRSRPDPKKFLISKKDLTTFCFGMNLSTTDSTESSLEKLWLGLTNPELYDKKYRVAPFSTLWRDAENPFPFGWTQYNEQQYQKKVLLEGFFNPFIYGLEVTDLNKKYDYIDRYIKTLSAFEKLHEQGLLAEPWKTKGLNAIDAFRLLNDSLSRYGYSLLILHPNIIGKSKEYTTIQYDYFNVISIRKGFEKEIIRIYKLVGIKAEQVAALRN